MRSFKVTDFNGTNWKPICDFLLVINSNYLASFPSYGRLLVEFSLSIEGCLTLTPPLGVIPANVRINFTCPKTRGIVLLDAENHTIVSSFTWTQYQNVTEWHTDGIPLASTDDHHTLPLIPPKGAQKGKTAVFPLKSHFTWRKSATKFLCVKTISGRDLPCVAPPADQPTSEA